jgi:hypothetical protein
LSFKFYTTKPHKESIARPHTAWSEEDRKRMFAYAKKNDYSAYALLNILFQFAARIQDATVLTFRDITGVKRVNGVGAVVIKPQK